MALQELATVEMVRNVISGATPVAQATNAVNAQNAQSATSAGSATNATTADKVAHKLTITMGDTTEEFDGSEDKIINIPSSGTKLYKHFTTRVTVSGEWRFNTISSTPTAYKNVSELIADWDNIVSFIDTSSGELRNYLACVNSSGYLVLAYPYYTSGTNNGLRFLEPMPPTIAFDYDAPAEL